MNRLNRGSLHLQWIDRITILVEPEVEVRTCSQACAPHISYQIALFDIDPFSDAFGETIQVLPSAPELKTDIWYILQNC